MITNSRSVFSNAALTVVRIIVGVLFVLSGLVKADDPLGLGYKMQEFFEIWNTGLAASSFLLARPLIAFFSFLHQYSLGLSIAMITFEVLSGVALLVGWKPSRIVNLLLVLIVFFTFLTGYAYTSGKFKNCGCFGDCIPITPLASFIKDLVLLFLILLLVFNKKYITPAFSKRARTIVVMGSLILTLLFQWYVLYYLPVVDCLPFKKGANITEGMKIPANAIPDSFAIRFVYKKAGKPYEFSPTDLPADLNTYQYVTRTDKLIRKGNAEPPIKGFSLISTTDADSTNVVLSQPTCVLLFFENFNTSTSLWMEDFKKTKDLAAKMHIPVYIVTTSFEKAKALFKDPVWAGMPIFTCDYTAIRTAARTSPCLYILQDGTIYNKYSFLQINKATKDLSAL